MDLKNKIMKLYEDVLSPEKARKIVLLLKYVIVDGETDLNKIKDEIGVGKAFIQNNIEDDNIIINYLTLEELKKFRLKMDAIIGKNNKLIRFIKLVLEKNETNLEVICKTVPVSIETINSYINDKEKMLRYLTVEEYKIILSRINPNLEKTKTKLERLIKCVLVDGETNLNKIEKKANVKIPTIRKHVENPKELEKYLSKESLDYMLVILKKQFKEMDEKEYKEDVKLIKQIISDILDTRYLYVDICARNLFSIKKFENYLYDEEFMKREFPQITPEMIKFKIDENDKIRIRKPRDMFIVEDRFCVMIAKKDVHYLSQFDNKRIQIASHYIGTGANLDSVIEYFKLDQYEALTNLASRSLEKILDEKYYDILKHCLSIENKLIGNDLANKKQFIIEVISFLEQNNFDLDLAMLYFKIPNPLFTKVLNEIVRLPYASQETKNTIENILGVEKENKVK